ncbi:MAG: serine/threonine-protein kinase [Geothrix sp.]|nr:serine/threonine-protein kinase [Geothrix sp.]
MLDQLGKFTLLAPLGKGAMGEVYLGRDPSIGRDVAIKTIRADLAEGLDVKARFQREARAAGALSHPNIVTIYEFGEQDGLLYLAMEYVKGECLQTLLGALSRDELLEVLAQVCEGLEHAHRHGIVHRDVKPANVMVLRERGKLTAKVMDFGVARLSGSNLTESGTVVGTVSYMAPECLMEGVAEAASDQFAVGVMLWEGLMGSNPYKAETTGATVYKIINETNPLAREEATGLSPALRKVLRDSLARDPKARFPSAGDLAQALRAAKGGEDPEQATTYLDKTPTAPHRRLPKRRPWLPWALAGLAGAGLLALGASRFMAPRSQPAPGTSAGSAMVLEEAAKFWEAKPDDALKLAESVLSEEPGNARAWALKLACLYHQNRMVAFGEALQASRDQGVQRAELLAVKPYKTILDRDKDRRRLPEDLRKALLNP